MGWSLLAALILLLANSIRCVNSQSQDTPIKRCESWNQSDFRFSDITSSSVNITWLKPSSDLISNASSIETYRISYLGNYRGFQKVGEEMNVSANEPNWREVTQLSPWPTQYLVCLEIYHVDDGGLVAVEGEFGCGILCTKLDHFDYFAVAAMGSAGMLILALFCSLGCAAKWEDPYQMSTEDIIDLTKDKKKKSKKRKKRRVQPEMTYDLEDL